MDLEDVQSVQQVRAVWNESRFKWELHIVCKLEVNIPDEPGEKTVGIDLGVKNFVALAYEDGFSELYPLNCLKQDDYYYSKHIARCDTSFQSNSRD